LNGRHGIETTQTRQSIIISVNNFNQSFKQQVMETKIESTESVNDPIFIEQNRRKGFTLSQADVVNNNSMDAIYADESQAKQLYYHLKSIFEPENDAKVKALEEIVNYWKGIKATDDVWTVFDNMNKILEQHKLI
jgi:hypothetical protein